MVARSVATATDTQILAALHAAVPALGPFSDPEFDPRGARSENWTVQAARGPLRVKVPRADATPGHAPTNRAYPAAIAAADFLTSRGLPAAKIHLLDAVPGHLDGRLLMVLDWFEGVSGAELQSAGERPVLLFEAIGRALGEFHGRTRTDVFQETLAPGGPKSSSWAKMVDDHLRETSNRMVKAGLDEDPVLTALMEQTQLTAHEVSPVVRPTLCNGNIWTEMMIFTNGTVDGPVALVDHKAAGFRDPLMDHAKPALFTLPKLTQQARGAYWAAYTAAFTSEGGTLEAAAERFGVASALVTLRSIPYHHWVGNQQKVDFCRSTAGQLLTEPTALFPGNELPRTLA